MDKLEFVAKQLDKTKKKRYEQLVVHRIWNSLNDLRVKFVTQQFVKRPDGRAMTDMYFPQLGVHIEVNEGHHKLQIEEDKQRQADIVDATGHEFFNVDATKTIEEIHSVCDKIVDDIRLRIETKANFEAWNLEAEMNPETYIKKGYVDVSDDAGFRTMADAASCFGKTYKGLQRSYIRHPVEVNKYLWFPKFYENEKWNNQFQDNEETVIEFCKIEDRARAYIDEALADPHIERLLFARVRGPLGDLLYRYKGEYALDRERTSYENGRVYKRVSTRSRTYPAHESPAVTEVEPITSDFQEIYESVISDWGRNDQIKLAALILNGLSDES